MTGETKLNVILGQSHAIKEIYNVKKQDLELQQQRDRRLNEKRSAQNRGRILRYDLGNKVEEKPDKKQDRGKKTLQGKIEKEISGTDEETTTDGILDIMV